MSEEGLESVSFPYDAYLTVRGLLQTHYGLEHGDEIYELLKRTAQGAAESTGRVAQPGLVFSEEGGEFVGMTDES
ncbi:hypothetical protein EBT16_05515 [bacterium]|nr:hypothetical protein [bacterium]